MNRAQRIAAKRARKEKEAALPQSKKETREAFRESSPVFVMGRGGSGTRLMSSMVQELGFFFGNKINASQDSIDWKRPIVELAMKHGAQIELPLKISEKEQNDLILAAIKSLKPKFGTLLDRQPTPPWGFKIPHLILVFPLMAEVFPNARFVHLVRHPVPSSVSKSRRKSDKTSRANGGQGLVLLPSAIKYAKGEKIGKGEVLTKADLKGIPAWKLNAYSWNHQVDRAHEYGTQFLKDKYLEVLYEDACDRPQIQMNRLTSFLDLPEREMKTEIKPSPSSAYDKNNTNKEVWEVCKKTAKKFGYTY
jgi:hypothetical protein